MLKRFLKTIFLIFKSKLKIFLTLPSRSAPGIGAARGGMPPEFFTYIVIFCFKMRYPKQISVIRLTSNTLAPKFSPHTQNFGLAAPLSPRFRCTADDALV